MGRLRKGYNWKARTQTESSKHDESEVKKIKLDISVQAEKYDSCNALVLPSTSKLQKVSQKQNQQSEKKPLTKKQRKKLQHILDTREKKKNRAELLSKLQEVQASQKELESMMSISKMQTTGLKRHFLQKLSKNSTRMKDDVQPKSRIKDPNVLGLDPSSSESETSDSECDEDENSQVESEDINSTLEKPSSSCNPEQNTKTEMNKSTSAEAPKTVSKPAVVSNLQHQRKTMYVEINRDPEIQAALLKLPILSEEQVIMEAIEENPVTVICGETGSGKTTQVPQFLYEAGYTSEGIIGVTEPRRIAAISMSKRVAKEMNLTSDEVSYLIRFSGNVTDKTKIKFMTDGVLMKEIQNDFLLSRYTVIIIDEAHERSVYSDILIGLLSRIVPLRNKKGKPLKLIIMSATLRVEDFSENTRLFKTPPAVLKVDSRQFPVTIHFNKHTVEDYVSEAYKKVCKIHQQLPEGGILVFVTGQQEVLTLCKKLRKRFPKKTHYTQQNAEGSDKPTLDLDEKWDDVKAFKKEMKASHKKEKLRNDVLPIINLDDYSVEPMDEDQLQETDNNDIGNEGDDDFLPGSSDEEEEAEQAHKTPQLSSEPLFVLPLFSLLPPEKQALVFSPPPNGMRLCVIATNVAETSLTIPNICYVVDSGKTKTRLYDKVTGISAFDVIWTSKASANQRAGRAGRTGPGHCYRLYSSAVFTNDFPKFSVPEIIRRPVDDLFLQMKAMGIDKVINFPFPTPPDQDSLKAAEQRLILLGALEAKANKRFSKEEKSSTVTALGRAMASFPLSPRYAKMLALSHQQDLLPYMIAIISALTVQEVFMEPTQEGFTDGDLSLKEKHSKWKQIKTIWASQGASLALGDFMVLLKAVGASEVANCSKEFCERHGLRHKAIVEIRKLRQQITNEVNLAIPQLNLYLDPQMAPPSDLQCRLIRQLVLTGMVDHIARRVDYEKLSDEEKVKARNAYQCMDVESYVFIHPKSVLHKERPEFVMYQEIFETSKMFMRVVSAVEVSWLPIYAPQLCKFSEPLAEPSPRYDPDGDRMLCHCTSTFGRWAWPIPSVEIEFPTGLECVRWFAVSFLEGHICPKMKNYADLLLSPAKVMIKSWAKLQKRTENLLQALVSKSVTSKLQLETIWQENKRYLLDEYRQWLPESVHYEVGQLWPPLS